MQGEYTKESCEEWQRTISRLSKSLHILQELNKWIDKQLDSVEPCEWANLKGVKQKIKELQE